MSVKRISLQFSYAFKGWKMYVVFVFVVWKGANGIVASVWESNYLVVSHVKSLVIYVIMFEFPCAL